MLDLSAVTDIYTVSVLWLWQRYAAAILDQPLFFWELYESTTNKVSAPEFVLVHVCVSIQRSGSELRVFQLC